MSLAERRSPDRAGRLSIVLLRPPAVFPKWAHATSLCPPLGLAYLAAALREAGYVPRCIDAVGEDPFQRSPLPNTRFLSFGLATNQIVERIGDCDVLGVSLMFSHDWPIAKSIIGAIRRAYPRVIIVAGGEHPTAAATFCLEDCPAIDACVVGEGEETIVELVRALEQGRLLSTVEGIVCRTGDCVTATRRRARIRAVDDLPWPAWDLFPLENYLANGLGYGLDTGRSVPILASRGCPFECTFCSSPTMWTQLWRVRAVDEVIREMQHYIDRYQARNFDFYDLTTIVRKQWVIDFCRQVIERNWRITWQMPAGTRSEALDEEALGMMARAGLKNISYAPESGSPASLRVIKKKVHLERMQSSIRAALDLGLNVKLNMIMGFPSESRRELGETIAFLREMAAMGVHDAFIACFAPYPGSELFDELQRCERIPALDDDFFFGLTSYSDIFFSRSYAQGITDRELTAYRLRGMAAFYTASFAARPARIGRLLGNLLAGREESRLDMALRQMISRFVSSGRARRLRAAVKTSMVQ